MPRVSRGPQLYLKRRADGEPVWYIRDGDRRLSTGCAERDSHGAREALGRYIAATARPDFGVGDPDRVRVADVLSLYATDVAPSNSRPKEVAARLANLGRFFGALKAAEVTPSTCAAYVRERGASAAARRELEDLRAALRHAWRSRKLAMEIPVALPPKSRPRERWLTRSEAARLLAATLGWSFAPCSDVRTRRETWAVWGRDDARERALYAHVRRFVVLGLATGTRHDAILGLGWRAHDSGGHVDIERGLVYRRAAGARETAKRKPPVPMLGSLAAHLRRWKQLDGPLRIFVVTFDGTRMDRMQRAWRSAVARAGLDAAVTPHVMRHTFVTWQLQRGDPIWIAAGRAGMTPELVESTYGHHSPDYLRDRRARA